MRSSGETAAAAQADQPAGRLSSTRRHWPFFLEKWYCDAILDDGTLLVVLIGQLELFGLSRGHLSAELHRPDGTVVRGDASVGKLVRNEHGVAFKGGSLSATSLEWHTSALSGRLSLRPRLSGTSLRDPLLTDGKRRLRWVVEVPDGTVDGEVTCNGERIEIRGRCYRDYLALDLLPWRLDIRELHWGRAFDGERSSWWIKLRTRKETVQAWSLDNDVSPEPRAPRLEEERKLQEMHVSDLPVLRIGLLRSALRRIVGDPYQVRFLARATVGFSMGWAVREEVSW